MKILNFKNLRWFWVSVLFMLVDIGSKYWIKINFHIGEALFISPYCNFYYIYNSGLAFGLFSSINLSYRWLFIWIIILIILVFIVVLCSISKFSSKYCFFAYSMIIGGALGNLCDRIIYGSVIDFIDFHISNWHWPIFNLADVEICMGTIILIIRNYCIFLKRNL